LNGSTKLSGTILNIRVFADGPQGEGRKARVFPSGPPFI